MSRHDPARVERILSALAVDDAMWLSSLLEPLWRQRQRRLERRDDAIRRALELLAGETNPAGRLATMMAQQAGQRWASITGNHLTTETIAMALALNDGTAMTERHIRRIAGGNRTPGT